MPSADFPGRQDRFAVVEPVIMLNEFATGGAHVDSDSTEHALILPKVWFPVLLVLYVKIKSITFEEDFQVGVVVEDRMSSDFVEHSFQSLTS